MYVLDNDNGKFVLWQLTCLKYVCDPDMSKKINPKGFAGWDPRSTKISTAQMIDTFDDDPYCKSGECSWDALMMYHWDEKKLWVMLAKIMSEGNDGLKLYEVDRWDLTAMRNAKINPLYEPNGFVYKGETSDHYLIEIGDSKTANTRLIKLLMSSKDTVKSLPNEVGADFVKISAIDADIDGFFYLGDKTGLSKFNVRGDLENHSINKNQVVDVVVAKDSIFSIEKNYNFGKIQGKLELNRWNYYIMQYDKNLNLGATYPIGYDRSILYGGQPFGQDWSYVSRLAYDPVTERLAYLTVEGIYFLDPNSELVAGENPVIIAEQIALNQYTKPDLYIDIDFDSEGYFYTLQNKGKVSKFEIVSETRLYPSGSFFVHSPPEVSSKGTNPQKISIDQLDNLYVIEPVNHEKNFDTPRIQKYSKSLEFVTYSSPKGKSGEIGTFLAKGDFQDIQDVAVSPDTLFVAEKGKLQRVHFFDASPLVKVDPTTAKVLYVANRTGTDNFEFQTKDLFESEPSEPAKVTIEVVDDVEPPLITSEFDIANTIVSNDDSTNEHEMISNIRAIKPYLEKRTTAQYLSLYGSEDLTPLLQETLEKYSTEDSASENKDNLIKLREISTTIQIQNDGGCPGPLYVKADTKDPDNVFSQGGILSTNADIQYYFDSIIALDDFDKEPDVKKIPENNSLNGVITALPEKPTIYPVGENLVKVTTKDGAGNESTCNLYINVQDNTPPTIESPERFVTPVQGVLTKVTVNEIPTPIVFDTSDSRPTLSNDLKEEGYPVGHNVLTWTATDSSGNSVNATQVIFIEDKEPPDIPSLDPIIVKAVDGYSNMVDFKIPVATDISGIRNQTTCSPSIEKKNLPIGTTMYLCSAMDNALLSSMIAIQVHVVAEDLHPKDGVADIIQGVDKYSFSDGYLGGTTTGGISKRLHLPDDFTIGDTTKEVNNLIVIDAPEENHGVIIIAKPESRGLNEDGDCYVWKDFGEPLYITNADCFDEDGNMKDGINGEAIDEDPYNGKDDDGDGFIDEDDNTEYQGQTQEAKVCPRKGVKGNYHHGIVDLIMDSGDIVSVTCDDTIRVGGLGGETITIIYRGLDYSGFMLPANNIMYYDPSSDQLTADPENTYEIFLMTSRKIEGFAENIEEYGREYNTLKPDIEMFGVGSDNAVYYNKHVGDWSGWSKIISCCVTEIESILNGDGSVEMFGIGNDGAVWNSKRSSSGSWSDWSKIAPPWVRDIELIRNGDGSIEIFGIGEDYAIYLTKRSSSGSWSDSWSQIIPPWSQDIELIRNGDGSLQAVVAGGDRAVYTSIQSDSGSWPFWSKMMPCCVYEIELEQNSDGSVEMVGIGNDGQIFATKRSSSGSWSDWSEIAPAWSQDIEIIRNGDGDLQVAVVGGDHAVYTTIEPSSGSWPDWSKIAPPWVQDIDLLKP